MKQFNDIYKKTTNANCICDNEIEKMKTSNKLSLIDKTQSVSLCNMEI